MLQKFTFELNYFKSFCIFILVLLGGNILKYEKGMSENNF